jgi:hypothetical protein
VVQMPRSSKRSQKPREKTHETRPHAGTLPLGETCWGDFSLNLNVSGVSIRPAAHANVIYARASPIAATADIGLCSGPVTILLIVSTAHPYTIEYPTDT